MKKQLFVMAAVLVASAAMTSCSSELSEVQTTQVEAIAEAAQTYHVSIKATKGEVTRALTENEGLSTTWLAGEKVFAYVNDAGDPVEMTVTIDGTDATKATLDADFTGTFTTDTDLYLYYLVNKENATYEGQNGLLNGENETTIDKKFNICKAVVDVTNVGDGTKILETTAATFAPLQAITKFTLKVNGTAQNATVLKIKADGLQGMTGEGDAAALVITAPSATSTFYVALQNTNTDQQTYTFTATIGGKDYTGTKKVTLVNGKYYLADINLSNDITEAMVGNIAALTYNTSAQEPTITVTDGETTLTKGSDFTVSYKNSSDEVIEASEVLNAGTYKAVITGAGLYTGSVTKEFTINKADNTITLTPDNATINTTGNYDLAGKASANQNPTFTYAKTTTGNPDVITLTDAGLITAATSAGYTTITITSAETTNYNAANATFTIYVKKSTEATLPAIPTETTSPWTD